MVILKTLSSAVHLNTLLNFCVDLSKVLIRKLKPKMLKKDMLTGIQTITIFLVPNDGNDLSNNDWTLQFKRDIWTYIEKKDTNELYKSFVES